MPLPFGHPCIWGCSATGLPQGVNAYVMRVGLVLSSRVCSNEAITLRLQLLHFKLVGAPCGRSTTPPRHLSTLASVEIWDKSQVRGSADQGAERRLQRPKPFHKPWLRELSEPLALCLLLLSRFNIRLILKHGVNHSAARGASCYQNVRGPSAGLHLGRVGRKQGKG